MSRVSIIKKSQKESQLRKVISELIQQISIDEQQLLGLTVSRVVLSPDKSVCTVFFHTIDGEATFDTYLARLKLFKPSLRHALAQKVPSRYVPELVFRYDRQLEKQLQIEHLLDQIKDKPS